MDLYKDIIFEVFLISISKILNVLIMFKTVLKLINIFQPWWFLTIPTINIDESYFFC